MNHERQSNVDLVRIALANGTPRREIPQIIKRSRTAVSTSISYLRRTGELPPPTPEESRRTMQEAVSNARGGVLLQIEPYVRQGMKPKQIEELFSSQGLEIDIKKIRSSTGKIRRTMKYEAAGSFSSVHVRTPIEAAEAKKLQAAERRSEKNKIFFDRGISNKDIKALKGAETTEADPHRQNLLVFARKLIGNGYIEITTVNWDIMKQISDKYEKHWTEDSSKALVIEAYIKSKRAEFKGRRNLTREFIDIGKSIDERWYNSDIVGADLNFVKYKLWGMQI